MKVKLPGAVREIVQGLRRHEFQAYVVGGAVRDLFLERPPKDWDVATDARPEEVEKIFRKTIPTGRKFGTVTVLIDRFPVQVTTFRQEWDYRDQRRPHQISFHEHLEADLARRDFTMNAMGYDLRTRDFIDPFGGRKDLKRNRLRTVGAAAERFSEDTLRVVRAGRFISELGLTPDAELNSASRNEARNVPKLSAERIRDELSKLLLGKNASRGLLWLDRAGVLSKILPELEPLKGVAQGGWHRYDVFRHTLRSVDRAPADLAVRMALLLHDLAKPTTRTRDRTGYHFFGHEKLGAQMSEKILKRLRYPNSFVEDVSVLVRHHLFEIESIVRNDSAIRRLVRRIGEGRIDRLIELRRADIRACGPRQRPSKTLDDLAYRIEKIRRTKPPLSVKDLACNGHDVMEWLHIPPGPKVGLVLRKLLGAVLNHPKLNEREKLKALLKRKPH